MAFLSSCKSGSPPAGAELAELSALLGVAALAQIARYHQLLARWSWSCLRGWQAPCRRRPFPVIKE